MPDDAATADHIHPRGPGIRRPGHVKGQIVMACHRCNQARGAVWNTLLNVARNRGASVIAGPQ